MYPLATGSEGELYVKLCGLTPENLFMCEKAFKVHGLIMADEPSEQAAVYFYPC